MGKREWKKGGQEKKREMKKIDQYFFDEGHIATGHSHLNSTFFTLFLYIFYSIQLLMVPFFCFPSHTNSVRDWEECGRR
jgi:hypothetical protein